ncbi:MAG TPA: DegT/DnrJ/EryC1/StrS family aminotransferase [Candidatus Hodarchaeales archaeon]|nr:DegT/DnrJ/EryC1/StrS family aminotransferase [Candidatus Hodarchaeales archaeon]
MSISRLIQELRKENINSRTIYSTPTYQQPAYRDMQKAWRWARAGIKYPDYSKVSLPVTERIAKSHFEIPVHPGVSQDQAKFISSTIRKIFKGSG